MKRKRSQRIEPRSSIKRKRKGSRLFQEMIEESENLLSRSRSRSLHLSNQRKSSMPQIIKNTVETQMRPDGLLYLVLSSLDDQVKLNSHQIYLKVKKKLSLNKQNNGTHLFLI